MHPHHDYVLVGRRDALTRDFAVMLDDMRIAFTKPARHTPKGLSKGSVKGPAKGLAKGRGQRPSPAPAVSRKPD
jgi:ribonuclease P protein component